MNFWKISELAQLAGTSHGSTHHHLSISARQDKAQGMGKFVHAAGDWPLAVEDPHYDCWSKGLKLSVGDHHAHYETMFFCNTSSGTVDDFNEMLYNDIE